MDRSILQRLLVTCYLVLRTSRASNGSLATPSRAPTPAVPLVSSAAFPSKRCPSPRADSRHARAQLQIICGPGRRYSRSRLAALHECQCRALSGWAKYMLSLHSLLAAQLHEPNRSLCWPATTQRCCSCPHSMPVEMRIATYRTPPHTTAHHRTPPPPALCRRWLASGTKRRPQPDRPRPLHAC